MLKNIYKMAMLLIILGIFFNPAWSQTCSSVGVVNGTIRLGFIFPFSGKDGEFCSSEPIAENIALVAAAIYAVKNLPDAARIPGVTLGLEAFDSCSSAAVGVQNVLKYMDSKLYSMNVSLCSDVILRPGIIGPMGEEVAQAVSPLLSFQSIPLISYGTSSAVLTEDREKHRSFLRLVPSDKILAQILVDILWSTRWNYIRVLYSGNMETTVDELQKRATDAGICLSKKIRIESRSQEPYKDAIVEILDNSEIKVVVLLLEDTTMLTSFMKAITTSIGDTASNLHFVSNVEPTSQLLETCKDEIRGLISIAYKRQINKAFQTHLSSLKPNMVSADENPWFNHAWETINQCDLSQNGSFGVPCNQTNKFTPETFTSLDIATSNIIDAVYVYAEALTKLHQEFCEKSVGICSRFASMVEGRLLNSLLADEFTGAFNQTIVFENNGEPKHVEFEITNVQLDHNGNSTLVKVGVWDSDAGITLNTSSLQLWTSSNKLDSIPALTCPPPCTDLSCLTSTSSAKSFRKEGDVIIAGMFSIHDVNCSDFKTSEYIRMESMIYAVQRINNDKTILPNMTIGIEAFDTCSNSKVAGAQTFKFAAGFQNNEGIFRRKEHGDRQQYAIGVIGSDRNDITKAINNQLSVVNMVQLGYLSTSSSNGLENFYHVVGTDADQARVIIDILLRVDYKYIQIVGSEYANEAVASLKDLANRAGIFVANALLTKEDTSFDGIVHRLLAYPTAKVIVIFLESSQTNQFLGVLVREGLQQQLQIIASDKWGLNPSVVNGVESLAEDSITISPKSAANSDFESYFTALKPSNSIDPWFAEFWMERHKCQLPGKPIIYDESCSDSNVLIADDAKSRDVASIIDAVYVLATALDLLVRDKCPEEGNMCTNIASVSMDEWHSYIDQTAIESSSGSGVAIKFDGDRKVSAVYDVNKYQGLNSEFPYQTIGSWQKDIGLEGVEATDLKRVTSECPREVPPCFKLKPKLSTIEGDITIPALFSTHTAGDSALTCGALNLEQVVAVQAFIYALEEINKDSSILPELTLGATIADYCGSSLLAYDQFVNIVSNTSRYGHDIALVGPTDSEVASKVVSGAINPLGFTSISPAMLDNASISSSPYYISTKPPVEQVISTLTDLVRYFNWTYIAIVFTDSPSEIYQAELFTKEIEALDVCVAVNRAMPVDGNRLKMDEIISQISTTAGIGVAFAFLSDDHFSMLLRSKDSFGANAVNIMWVGSFLSTQDVSAFKNSNMATLSNMPYKYNLADFKTYLTKLDPSLDHNNPWFKEYFETITNCRIKNDYMSSVPVCEEGLRLASVDESLLEISDFVSDIIKSVYMIAQAAHDRLSSICGINSNKICSQFLSSDPQGTYNTIANVEIHPTMSDKPIQFENGLIKEKIVIVNQIGEQNPEEVQVGHWYSGTLTLDATKLKSYDDNGNIQDGVKPSKCPVKDCKCSTSPEPNGETGDLNQNETIEWNVEGYWVTIVLAASATCSVLMFLIICYLFYYRRNAVVIEASLSLSIWLFIGLLLMYAMNLAFMIKPTTIICGVRRVGVGFVYAIVFSTLSVKIIRINRLRRRLIPEEPIGFTGASSQTLFFFVFLMAEIVLVTEWLIFDNPATVVNSDSETQCSFEKLHLVASLSYVAILVLFSLLASICALNSSSVNSEARFIFLSCLSTICCVGAWTCVYVLADDTDMYEIPSVCVGLTVNATVIFIAIFFPKVNALCNVYSEKAEKHTRPTKMGQAYANTALSLHTNEEEALTNL